ncbi:MAG: hypothetical protein KAS59_09160 [Alphaproteobacteria bacterium]|nr:hypothetical protein [Alphaproteobacteria bacterium]
MVLNNLENRRGDIMALGVSDMGIEERKQKNMQGGKRIRQLAGDYVKLRVEETSGQKKPEIVAAELDRLTTELTDLLISDDVSSQRRNEIKKEVLEASFEEFFMHNMFENPEFNQTRVKLAHMVVYEESEKKWDKDTVTSFEKSKKSLPRKPLTCDFC